MPTLSLPRWLTDLLMAFSPCFTAPTMRTFQALVAGIPDSAGPAHRHRAAGRRPTCWPAPPRPGLPVLRGRTLVG
jgi:hypothetical protein